jgi:alkylation response protein AidB-like acyl-CoA dehydrogenase
MAIDLTLDDDQLLIQRSANEFFRRRYPSEFVRTVEAGDVGFSPEHWREMADLGWLGITIPAEFGGGGGRFLDLYPLYEEMGRFLVPSPHLDAVAIAGDVVRSVGTGAQRASLLPRIASGDLLVIPAVLEGDGSFAPDSITGSATRRGDDFIVQATKLLVPFARAADFFLVAVRAANSDDLSLLLIDAHADGVSCDPLSNIAGHTLSVVRFDGVSTPVENLVGAEGDGWLPLRDATLKGAVLQTATIVGASHAVLEMTNQYAKDRVQFGNPIGQYQAVQYLVTDILIDLHRADLLARQAAFRIDAGKPFVREAAIAVAFGKQAAAHLHRQAHEVHAGVAFIDEHDLQLYSRRSKFWENHLGDARDYRELIAEEMGGLHR